MQEDIQMYSCSSIDEKLSEPIWEATPTIVELYKNVYTNGVSLQPSTNSFTCRKHNGNSLVFEGILDRINRFSLGDQTLKADQVKKQTPYILFLFETKSLPIEIMDHEKVC